MTCTKFPLPQLRNSTLGLCQSCTKDHNAAKVRDRMKAKHRDEMLAKYGQPTAPSDWRKQARKPSADQKSGKSNAVRPPDKFCGNPKNCDSGGVVVMDARYLEMLERARRERVMLPSFREML